MSGYDSKADTLEHILKVNRAASRIANTLQRRALWHDNSKLESPEKEVFDEVTPKLASLTYGSPAYKRSLEEMGPALKHHYEANRHHPEHYEHGLRDMDLIDILEMFCDWVAAVERSKNSNFFQSLEINKHRFGMGDQLYKIFENTMLRWGEFKEI